MPIIAIGAPVQTYFPWLSKRLKTELIVPPHAEVANAVGAVAGNVVQGVRFHIHPLPGGEVYRVHSPLGVHDFQDLEEAVGFAEKKARFLVLDQVKRAGAGENIHVAVDRKDREVQVYSDTVLIDVKITAKATGRPRIGSGPSL
jgi:N-methylhydantoinase A/oxoprolinase/acetone carboxylase beta subunit